MALLPRFQADAEPVLRWIATPVPVPAAEMWLDVHRENRQVPRVRTVLNLLAEAVHSPAAIFGLAGLTGEAEEAADRDDRPPPAAFVQAGISTLSMT